MSESPPRALYLDIQATQDSQNYERGIPRYAAMHAAALAERPGAVRRLAMSPFAGPPRGLPPHHRSSPLLCWNTAAELEQARREGPIAYHLMSPLHVAPSLDASFPSAALTPEDLLVVTMYDAVPLLEPREYLHTRAAASSAASRFDVLRSADLVLTLSRHGVDELVDLLDLDRDRVAWIGGGVDGFFSPAPAGNDTSRGLAAALPDVRRPFVMGLTHHYERKNTELLVRGFGLLPAALREELQLVLVGSLEEAWRTRYRETGRQAGLTDDQLVLTGRISDDTLRALYQRARLFVAPSLSEGWGLPVAEAIACGCPAITSSTSALPEVLEFPPSTFDPRDPVSLATLVERALADADFNAELRAVGKGRVDEHRWPVVAERTLRALGRVEQRRARRARRSVPTRRLRLAFAGHLDATGAGEDRYGAEVVARLAEHADVDVYVPDRPALAGAGLTEKITGAFPLGALGTTCNPHGYHAIVHSLGAAGDTTRSHLAVAAGAPGIVWLHDAGVALPAPAPPSPAGELVPVEHRPRPDPQLLAAARVVVVDWEADRRLIGLGRAALGVPIETVPVGIDASASSPPTAAPALALVLGATPDDGVADGWLDALLAADAAALGIHAVLCGPPLALARFTSRNRWMMSTQPVVSLISSERHAELEAALGGAGVIVDATTDACAAAMSARIAVAIGRRVVTHRPAMAELGADYVRVVTDAEDPLDVLREEMQAPAPPPFPTSVAEVATRLIDIVETRLLRGRAA